MGISTSTVHRYEKQASAAPAAAPQAPAAPDLETLARQLEQVREIYGRLASLAVEDRRAPWERALDKLLPVLALLALSQLFSQNPGLAAAIQASGLPALQPAAPVPQVQPPAQPQPAGPVPDGDLLKYLLSVFQTQPPREAAQVLLGLADRDETVARGVGLLRQLDPSQLPAWLEALAAQGGSGPALASWLKANPDYTRGLLAALREG